MDKVIIKDLHQIQKNDLDKCADIGAKAFINDPSSIYILKEKLNYKALFEFYFIIYKCIFERTNIYSINRNIDGFIIISPIKNSIVYINEFIKNGGSKLIYKNGFGFVARILNFERNNIKLRKNHTDNDCWYIMQFGVSPEKQGKGIGSNIIKPILKWFDINKINCYLETFKEKNVKIYNHYGFCLKETITIPDKTKKQYALYRKYKATTTL